MQEAKNVRHLLDTLDILEFSIAASETFGKLSIELKRNGTEIGDFDLLIASICPYSWRDASHEKCQAFFQSSGAGSGELLEI